MGRVIESVEIINRHPKKPDLYKVGYTDQDKKITDIIEVAGTFLIYGEGDILLMEIRNCPVVISYMDAPEESEVEK